MDCMFTRTRSTWPPDSTAPDRGPSVDTIQVPSSAPASAAGARHERAACAQVPSRRAGPGRNTTMVMGRREDTDSPETSVVYASR